MTDAATHRTPAGLLTLLTDGPALVASGFTADADALHARLDPVRRGSRLRRRRDLGAVTKAVTAYLEGDLPALDALEVDQPGTVLQRRVWAALRDVPPGATVTYSQLAQRAGTPDAVRAAGTACGRNLVAPVVACHRAVRSDGTLGGYHYGLDVKRWLLDHERRAVGRG